MKLTKGVRFGAGGWMGLVLEVWLLAAVSAMLANAQAVATTTVQGTVYLANGQPGAGTMDVSWPAFTTASHQAIAAGRISVTIAPDGFVSVNLAPNQGATPAGLYYTVVYQLSDGTTSTEYWIVPAAAQANLAQVRAQIMPAEQAVQAVSKAYVDQAIAALPQSQLSVTGGTLTGPLYLNADPTQTMQAADKHYVDTSFNKAVPVTGGAMTGPLAVPAVNDVQSASGQTTLQAAVNAAGGNGAVLIPPTYAGTDGFTNPNGVYVNDLRQTGAQQFERNVKEFGAVCDGATDDTNALQAAIDYAQGHAVALVLPQGTCKTHTLAWHGESMGGLGKQVSGLMGFPGQDVLAAAADTPNFLANTRLHDLTIYVDVSVDASCTPAKARAAAGSCQINRPIETNSVFSPGGNGLSGTRGTGAAWSLGNCAIALPATTGAGGNSLNAAAMENVAIAAAGVDPMGKYAGSASTHTCGLYLAQWPKWTEFRNIDIRGVNTGIAMPALPGSTPPGLNADSNRWQNIAVEAAHGFTMAAGSNNDLDNVMAMAGNSAATGETPTGLILDFAGAQQGWTIRNAVVLPTWTAVQPQLAVTAAGGAVTGVSVGPEHGLGFDPYGTQIPLAFSGSCTAQAVANVNSDGSIGSVNVTQGGAGCSGTTTASVNAAGTWDTAAAVNLISGQNMTVLSGNLLKGNGGYTAWNAMNSQSYGAKWGGGGVLPGGGTYPGLAAASGLGGANLVEQFPGADFGAKLQACLGTLSTTYGGTCDARNFAGSQSMGANVTIATANATVLLPCATIATANQMVIAAGARNVSLRGCALRGGSTANGSQGGTAFAYSGAGAMVQVGDPTYAADTNGFHMDNVVINTTASTSASAQGLIAYRTQEMDLESLYFLGNQNQTGMTLDGTGNYTGGTFLDNAFNGFQTAVNAIGHRIANAATTDWMNASTFVRLHIDCPTSGGNPIAGTDGINLQQGDGNTFTGGDVEGCSTMLHLGPNAQNNTMVGLRNENSSNQIVADAGSAYNNWITGGTMFTGRLTDNGTRNSFLDTFHRSFNGMNGDWYGSQQDATVTNHYRVGIGTGNERGLLNRYQTDYGYRWTEGFSDATAGEQFYQLLDELNNVYRISVGQYNHGQSSTNNQTVINSAGTGGIVLNGSNNAGTGGVIFGSGGANETTVATIDNAGNAQFNGTLQVGGASTFTGSTTVKNQADAEVDAFLWAGATANQKESLIYKDYTGNSQWYLVKDTSNNWALNSATGGLDSFKAYQSTNGGDTYIGAQSTSGVVRVNYEPGSGSGFSIYGGGTTSPLYASFTGTAAIKFPGLAALSGHSCLQIDNSGYITNTGASCGSGTGGSGTVAGGTAGQIAYYTATGNQVGGTSTVPVTAGGTGASTASAGLANLGGGMVSVAAYGAVGDDKTDNAAAIQACVNASQASNGAMSCYIPNGIFRIGQEIVVNGSARVTCQSSQAVLKLSTNSTMNRWFAILSNFGQSYALTGAFTAGQTHFALSSATGLSVGQEVFLMLGQDPYDATQNYTRMFNRIVAISGNTVTLAVPLPEAVAAPVTQTSTLNTFAAGGEAQNVEIAGCGFDMTATDTNTGSTLNPAETVLVQNARNVHLHDLVGLHVGHSMAGIYNSENVAIENLVVDWAQNIDGNGGYGIGTWGSRNFSVRNFQCLDCENTMFTCESQGRGSALEHLSWSSTAAANTKAGLSLGGNCTNNRVSDYAFNPQNAAAPVTITSGDVTVDGISLLGSGNNNGYNLGWHTGRLVYKGQTFWSTRRVSIPFALLANQSSAGIDLPNGYYKSIQIYMSTLTGVTAAILWNTTNGHNQGTSVSGVLASGGTADIGSSSAGGALNIGDPDAGFNGYAIGGKQFAYSSNGSVPNGAYGVIAAEYYPDPANEFSNGNPVLPAQILAGTAPNLSIGGTAASATTAGSLSGFSVPTPAGGATLTQTVASGTLTLATNAIPSAACQAVTAGAVNSAAASGVVATDTVSFTANGSIKAVTGFAPATSGGLTVAAYPSAGYVNFDVCNWTGSALTPGALTLNWKVTR